MASVWDKLVLDTVWEKDGSTILLFHGSDLEAFQRYTAIPWLRSTLDPEDYLIRFMIPASAQRLMKLTKGVDVVFDQACLFVTFRNDEDATLFKLALA